MAPQYISDALKQVELRVQTEVGHQALAALEREIDAGIFSIDGYNNLEISTIADLFLNEVNRRTVALSNGKEMAEPDLVPGEEFLIEPGAEAKYAEFGSRYIAWVIDWVLLGALSVSIVSGVYYLAGQPQAQIQLVVACSVPFLLLGYWLYYAFQESSVHQGTLGKRAMKIRVVNYDNERLTFKDASVRFLGRLVSHLIPLFMGFFMMMLTEKKQALHDKIAKTYVVKTPDTSTHFPLTAIVDSGLGA